MGILSELPLQEGPQLLELLAALTADNPDGIEIKDREGRYLLVNPAAARILGRPVVDVPGRDVMELLPARTAWQVIEVDHRVMETGAPELLTFQAPPSRGGHLYRRTSSPYRDRSGNIAGVVGIVRDITDREAEEERRQKEADRIILRQNALLELARIQEDEFESMLRRILETDSETLEVERVSYWSFTPDRRAIVCDLMYRRRDRAFEKGFRLEAKDYPRYFLALEESRVVAAERSYSDPRTSEFTAGYLEPNGITSMMDVPVRIHGVLAGVLCHEHVGATREWPPQDQDFASSIADRISVSLEAEERRKAEEVIRRLNETLENRVAARTAELRAANEELETFTYSVSHDLRAPLRAVCGLSQVLLEDYPGRPLDREGVDCLSRIGRAACRMDGLIQDLLRYSRLSHSEITLEPTDVKEALTSILDEMDSEIRSRNARILVEEPLPGIRADRILLQQALTNLISNAIKFMPPGVAPEVRIRAEAADGTVRLSVIDNGIGIAPEHQVRIFRIFERLHAATDYPGVGIGLALVRKSVDRMGGKVGVESSPGRGSCFWIELPPSDGP
ncbi:MAG TPA: ATP-binding protein [Planctomycetota bacterium]|nr:ATP-binding protein [Planctomycetota bacterium]